MSQKSNQNSSQRTTFTASEADSQSDRFKEAARELETDESEERFDEALRKVGAAKQTRIEPPTMERDGYDDGQLD